MYQTTKNFVSGAWEVVCPCTASLSLGADYDRCRVTLVFNITQGEIAETDVSGLKVTAIADTPKVMSEGTGASACSSTPPRPTTRRRSSALVFGGQFGGADGGTRAARVEDLGVERAPIKVREEGLRHSVKIGHSIDFEIEDVVSFGVESGEPARLTGIFHPAGSERSASRASALGMCVRSTTSAGFNGCSALRRPISPNHRPKVSAVV
ncbi:MAG: DUF1326 domain-containing protein [Nitriliruptoraceae bacterium]